MTIVLALLLFSVPGAAFWSLMRGFDPVGRLVVSIAASIVTVAGAAQILLMAGFWSPGSGLVAVLLLSGLVAGLARMHRPRRLAHLHIPRPPSRPAAGAAVRSGANVTRRDLPVRRRDEDEEDWLYRD
ncbi:hypothetical protein [Actinomadura rudentiformis]|uniref:Uncharacterized protein n=1 Tax=Actinomadura rudentiformis TaxID=359158 RepID=A0A6H9YBI0_9ACTN|nr:hypothetical protein [Actinomadura rudentiformis]KAB2342365.1 hypothetical protein F8566_38045 [Actinomadura rudentiformis]